MTPREVKENAALQAATAVFTRFGYARTTMGDIASEAGMSRPALYLLFDDKQVIFDRVIKEMDQRKLDEIRSSMASLDHLEDKLLYATTNWGLHGVELAVRYPEAADLFDLRFQAVRSVYANFEALVVSLIDSAVARSNLAATSSEIAHSFVYGLRGFREAASTVEDMRAMIVVQVKTLIAALKPSV